MRYPEASATSGKRRQILREYAQDDIARESRRSCGPCVAWRARWRIYLIEAALLGGFMISASLFTLLLEHPASPGVRAIASDFARRAPIPHPMAATAIALIHFPWRRRLGASFH